MRLLLDTHIALWLAFRRSLLLPAELTVLANSENDLCVSAVSIWELRIKWNTFFSSGERKGPIDPAEILHQIKNLGILLDPLTPEICATPLHIPMDHSDPFDQLLLTIAQETGRRLLTRDERLRGHPLAYHPA